ncbi:hypothetical protein Tco_0777121 [Tanacetum coccineum]
MCHISGIEPQFENINSNGPYIPMAAGQRKPETQWTPKERKSVNLDQRLKSLIMSVLPDDQMNYVINCLTAKSTWDDLILYHEGPFDVKESKVMDLKLCYNTFKFKEDSPDDEEDTRSSQEYMNDLEEEYQARALLSKSKRFFKKGTQRFSGAKATDQTECHKYGKKGHFDEEEVSSGDNEVTEVKTLMALADEERISVGKESAKNGEWIKISMKKHLNTEILKENQNLRNELKELTSITEAWLNGSNKVNQCISEQIPTQKKKILGIDQPTKDTSSSGLKDPVFVKSLADNSEVSITGSNKPKLSEAEDSTLLNHDTGKHPLPPLEKLTGAELVSRPKNIKSILKSKYTFKAETINEPSSTLARGNKSSSTSKTNSSLAGKLKNMKMEDDPSLAIVMKELNELKLKISKNKSSYMRNNNSQQRTNHRTCDHAEFMSSMNINQYHTGQGESSLRSRPARPAIPFPSCIHYGYNDHKSDDCVHYPICEIYGSYDHDTHGHNRIISLRRGIKSRNPQHVTKNCETCGSNIHTTSEKNNIK